MAFQFYNHLPKGFDFFKGEPISEEIWRNKYRWGNEVDMAATAARVCAGVYAHDDLAHRAEATDAMSNGLWMPGGRIIAGAGTNKHVTLMNCYVNGTIDDSMVGIHDAYGNIMFTMQQGGGIGTDWTPLRPQGAWLSRTQANASGPGPFISSADAIGLTVESAGERRGAQMWTIADTHPDLPIFIRMKHQKGVWTNGNISILVTDAFMGAVAEDEEWFLYHEVQPREREERLKELDFTDDNTGKRMYVYSVWKARALWELITRSTYEYSEPGVIFIDRVNDLNNLQYCEEIRCTNPCGEQPLPPHGTCNLGAVNLALMVKNPFSDEAEFDWELLRNTVRVGTRFLDNVIEVTNYPLPEQREEELSKRRIGLGFSGLASALAQMGLRYGSNRSAAFAGEIMKAVCLQTYKTSVDLAAERGAFPLYNEQAFWHGEGFAARKLRGLDFFGKPIRNGVNNTLAPTGTTSTAYGNVEASLEPAWQYECTRNVVQRDGSFKPSPMTYFTARLWKHMFPGQEFPRHFITADQLKVHEHIAVQEACQNWVDASISKTINLPENTTYAEFVAVYDMAFEAGLKGCTTYRPSEVRGSVFVSSDEASMPAGGKPNLKRPIYIPGHIGKVQWPGLNSAIYITIGRLDDGTPHEVFLNSKDQRNNEWMTTSTLLMSWLLRAGVDIQTICDELEQVSSIEGYMVPSGDRMRYRASLVALIGATLREMDDIFHGRIKDEDPNSTETSSLPPLPASTGPRGPRCPVCQSPNTRLEEGCFKCGDCLYSKC
jgi:ribonucleoside-diphosphate reductase alpha chain